MSLANLKALADDYKNFYVGKPDKDAIKEMLDALVDTLTKTKTEITKLKARVKALEDA